MRVGVVSRVLIPGGHVEWATGLGRGLQQLGHEVTLIYVRDSGFFPMFDRELKGLAFERTFRGTRAAISEALGWAVSMAALGGGYGKQGGPDPISWILAPFTGNWKERFDLLVFAEDFTGLAGLAASRICESPYVVFVHEAPGGTPQSLTYRFVEAVRRTVRRTASLTCAIDDAIAARMQMEGEQGVLTVPSGCEPVEPPSATRSDFVLADTRWTPARDPGFILEVAKLTPGVQYVMLGSFWTPQSERDFLEQRSRDRLEERVRMIPNHSSLEGLDLYRRAMVYIRWAAFGTGGWELGFPTGLRTAMSNSCPVLYDSRLGCASLMRSEIPEGAVEHNSRAYASKIMDLLSDPELVRTRSRQSLSYAQKFQWTHSAALLMGEVDNRLNRQRDGVPSA
ncbi:MAG: glycosyltransferase [Thermoplasmata archaeon]